MPRNDGTGPNGLGSMTGRGVGPCSTRDNAYFSYGCGMRLGNARGRRCHTLSYAGNKALEKQWLLNRKQFLEKELELISNIIANSK
ncbi:MAG: DUF5320 domain-containing protein [Bacilli bacterium]|nr:DUF5320 domain-containing protein [Bacilli bacterium]